MMKLIHVSDTDIDVIYHLEGYCGIRTLYWLDNETAHLYLTDILIIAQRDGSHAHSDPKLNSNIH